MNMFNLLENGANFVLFTINNFDCTVINLLTIIYYQNYYFYFTIRYIYIYIYIYTTIVLISTVIVLISIFSNQTDNYYFFTI